MWEFWEFLVPKVYWGLQCGKVSEVWKAFVRFGKGIIELALSNLLLSVDVSCIWDDISHVWDNSFG